MGATAWKTVSSGDSFSCTENRSTIEPMLPLLPRTDLWHVRVVSSTLVGVFSNHFLGIPTWESQEDVRSRANLELETEPGTLLRLSLLYGPQASAAGEKVFQ